MEEPEPNGGRPPSGAEMRPARQSPKASRPEYDDDNARETQQQQHPLHHRDLSPDMRGRDNKALHPTAAEHFRHLSLSPAPSGRLSPAPHGSYNPAHGQPFQPYKQSSWARFWDRNKPAILVALSQLFGASMNLSARLLELEGEGMHPVQVLLLRQSLTSICCLTYMWWMQVPDFPIGKREIRWLLVARGFTGFFGIFGMWYSMMYLPLADATVITFLAPGVAGFVCWFLLREPFTRIEQLATVVALLGVVLIAQPAALFSGGTSSSTGGDDHSTTEPPEQGLPGADHQTTAQERLVAVGVALLGVLGAAGAFTTLRSIGKRALAVMEPVVYDETPLAEYLKDGGDGSDVDWAAVDSSPPRPSSSRCGSSMSSPPASPSPFAPTGRPLVKPRFRSAAPPAIHSAIPGALSTASRSSTLRTLRRNCSAAVVASIDRADNAKFLEQFRYTIVASQLLSGHSIVSHRASIASKPSALTTESSQALLSTEGIAASILGALAVAVVLSWLRGSTKSYVTRKRLAVLVALLAASGFVGQVYMKRQWLRYRREQSLSEMVAFVANSHDFDSATEATLSLVQEVELVSRGYRITAPLPPISRLEDRSQSRKCVRLRRALRSALGDSLKTYNHISSVVRAFSEQTELEKYYDMYDVTDLDMSDALQGFSEDEFDDPESLRTLKILAARFHTTRKMLLCALLAFDANGESTDLLRWSTAVESLRSLNKTTKESYLKMQSILSEEESFPVPATPKIPLTPNRERWRSQLRKLNSLSTGIRGLQAKLHLLREESDRALDDSNDVSELGPNLMSQYESIGVDLKDLMAAWEEGKTALALGIDRNEKRLSSMSTALSPTTSLSGLTTVGEGGTADALKALTGESPPSSEAPEPDTPEVFEAVALPRPRSLLTREERIAKMKDEREQKALARQQMDATRGMLRELETVINLRPRNRASTPAPGRVSM